MKGMRIMKKMKKEKKKWSKKKKLILYPIISFFVIIALLSACTAAGFISVEHDVTDVNRKDRYMTIFTEIIKKKAGVDLTKPKTSDFSEMREIDNHRADEDGYLVTMEGKVHDKAGNAYKAKSEFWTTKSLKRYQVDLAKCQKIKEQPKKEAPKKASEKVKAKTKKKVKEKTKPKTKKKKEKETTEQKAEDAVYDIKIDALKNDFDLDDLDVESNAKIIGGKEYPAVDVVLTIYRDDPDMGKLYGEKLKKIVLKHVKYGSVTVQKYQIDYQWDNYN